MDEDVENRYLEEQKDKGIGRFKKKKRKNSAKEREELAAQYEKDREERKRLAESFIPEAKIYFDREAKQGPLVMGKQKKALETSLDFAERAQLKEAIAEQCKEYKNFVNEKYSDS